jgi:hypothetical protein
MPRRAKTARGAFAAAVLVMAVRFAGAQEVVIYPWDGSADDGIGWIDTVSLGEYVQRYDPGSGGGTLTGIAACVSGIRESVAATAVVYAADGPGGEPGTLLARSAATTIPVAVFPLFTCTSIPAPAVALDQPVFGGIEWAPGLEAGVFVGLDTSPATPLQDMRDRSRSGTVLTPWAPVTDFRPDARALGIGFVVEGAHPPCVPNGTTLCLNAGRFEVKAAWRRQDGSTGEGTAVPLTDDSGYFWFFNSANIELVTKVLNACFDPFQSYWVFAAGLTNVEVTLTVTDTRTGWVKTYLNPLGTPYAPIQDTSAFSTCP